MTPLTRVAIEADHPAIEALYAEWGRSFGHSRNDLYFVSELENEIVGAANLAFDDPVFVIRSLYVKSEARGRGVATSLLAAIDSELGIAEAFCLCFKSQRGLFEQVGMQEIGGMTAPEFLRERFERIRESEPNVTMMKRLSEVEVRPVQISDIWQAMSLLDEFQLPDIKTLSENDVREIYSRIVSSGGVVLGAFKGGELIGTCTLNICANLSWSGRPFGIIENIIVTETERNKGVGKNLLLVAARTAVSKDCYKIALMTQQRTSAMEAFYKSAGFSDDKVGYQIRFDAPLAI
ncbi:MAG: GNAT family N-acetyltransferase [Pseudomonadales bacterium]|nr:GNAT family N-acetyltransferase [Pseudomonadales bacterium]